MNRMSDCSPMNYAMYLPRVMSLAGIGMLGFLGFVQTTPSASAASSATPYKIINTTQTLGTGGIDYVYADNDGHRLYVPRGSQILVFDLDTLKPVGAITN